MTHDLLVTSKVNFARLVVLKINQFDVIVIQRNVHSVELLNQLV